MNVAVHRLVFPSARNDPAVVPVLHFGDELDLLGGVEIKEKPLHEAVRRMAVVPFLILVVLRVPTTGDDFPIQLISLGRAPTGSVVDT